MSEPAEPKPSTEVDGDAALLAERFQDLAFSMDINEVKPIFRRFGDLNLLHMLMLQAELLKLRKDFYAISVEKPIQRQGYLATYALGTHWDENEDETVYKKKVKEKKDLLGKLREKLKEYNSALLEAAQLRNLEPPEAGDADYLRLWLDTDFKRERPQPDERACWDAQDDLVVLQGQLQKENKFVLRMKMFLYIFFWKFKSYPETQTNSSSPNVIHLRHERARVSKVKVERQQAFTSRLVMALFGVVALIVPTIIMAKIQGINTSLITTSVATVLFALILAIGATDSTGKEVLAATAAYAAVLVVFIGTSLASPPATPTGNVTGS